MSDGLELIATRAQADADQMWEEVRARSSHIVELKNKIKSGCLELEEVELALLEYVLCATLCEVRRRNIDLAILKKD